jgi:hypothetical protein
MHAQTLFDVQILPGHLPYMACSRDLACAYPEVGALAPFMYPKYAPAVALNYHARSGCLPRTLQG